MNKDNGFSRVIETWINTMASNMNWAIDELRKHFQSVDELDTNMSKNVDREMEKEMMKLDPMYRVNIYKENKDTYRSFVKLK